MVEYTWIKSQDVSESILAKTRIDNSFTTLLHNQN